MCIDRDHKTQKLEINILSNFYFVYCVEKLSNSKLINILARAM